MNESIEVGSRWKKRKSGSIIEIVESHLADFWASAKVVESADRRCPKTFDVAFAGLLRNYEKMPAEVVVSA